MLPSLAWPKITLLLVAVPGEQGGEPLAGRPQPIDRDGDVLQQGGGAGRPAFRDGGVQALADVPQGVAGGAWSPLSTAGAASGSPAVSVAARRRAWPRAPPAVSSWYSTSRAAWSRTVRAQQRLVRARVPLGDAQGGRVEQLDGRRPGGDQGRQRAGGVPQRREDEQCRWPACGLTGTVRRTASATKASVPSLPTTRCSRMSTGRS